MRLSIQLLGRPLVTWDGSPAPLPRGRKAWGLLAYLLCSRGPASREQLASLLFSDADDPLDALRWNLAELRRLLGDPGAIVGQPVTVVLPPGTYVDVRVLTSGTWVEAAAVPGLGRELLEGTAFPSCPAFEAWLLSERRHLQAASEAVLREAALARLVAGQEQEAIDLAARLVALNPLEEAYQELLIRSYAVGGDREGTARQLSACVELFRRELGVEPGPAVFAAVHATGSSFVTAAVTGRAAARAQLEAGEAAINAGALEPGLQCLRTAVAEAHACGDLELKAKVLLAVGSALVYAAQGRDEEGAAALHEVISTSGNIGQRRLGVSAQQVLALIEALRGRYERAHAWLAEAEELAGDDENAQAGVLMLRGGCLVDTGKYQEGLGQLRTSLELAERCEDLRTAASSLAEIGRAHLLRDELSVARLALERCLEIARSIGTTSFLRLGCQLRDPCYEGLAATGLGLLMAAREDPEAAIEGLEDATRRCARSPDASCGFSGMP